MARRDNRLAARALADWAQHGFTENAAKHLSDKYSVSVRTLWRWKDALDDDPELSGLFRDRLNDYLDGDWTQHLHAALRETVNRMRDLIKTEDDLEKVVTAFQALGEVELTRVMLGGDANASADSASAEARRDPETQTALGPN